MRIAFAFAVSRAMWSSSSAERMRSGAVPFVCVLVLLGVEALPLPFVSFGFGCFVVSGLASSIAVAFAPPRATKSTLIISASPVSMV